MQKVKVSLNKRVNTLTAKLMQNTNEFVMQEATKNSCNSIYKNFNYSNKTRCADGDEIHFTAQMYNKFYTGRLCMLTFKNDSFVAMHTID